ncbi:MAG: YhdP family protein, partial [Marinobacter sp.]
LKVSVRDARADMLPAFVPVGAVAPDLYEWLTKAIREGDITHGEFYGHGQIGRQASGAGFSTAMKYHFRNGRVAYDPRWPEVTDAHGTVRVRDGNAHVVLEQASTGGLALQQGEVEVVPGENAPTVNVRTRTRASGEQIGYWLTETPLREMAGDAADALVVSGDYDLGLSLALPMEEDPDVGVEASVQTDNGTLAYPAADLRWENIRGSLAYSTTEGFSSDPLAARFLGEPVNLRLGGRPDRGSLTVTQDGQTDIDTLASRLMPGDQGIAGIEGRLPYTATLEFSSQATPVLRLDANGAGIWSQWPAPLAREAGPEERIEALVRWPGNERLQVKGHWGERLAIALQWHQQAFDRGQVVLGDGAAELPEDSGLVVRADMERFAPAQWKTWFEEYGLSPAADTAGETSGYADFGWLRHIELDTGALVVGDHTLPGVKATIAPDAGGWLITTDSDRASGQVQIPAGADRVWVDLEHLRLARSGDGAGEASPAPDLLTPTEQLEAFRELAAGQWPEVDVRIGALTLGDDPAGAWSFLLSPSPEEVVLQDLQGNIGELGFEGQVRWGVTSGLELTEVRGGLEGGGLQDLANLFGMEAPLTNERSSVDLDINWPGRPDQFTAGRLNGAFRVRLDEGIILENSDTAQLFRLFNLLNTDTLQRRLSFDFSDLYEAGVAFDAISGKALLDRGVMRWDPDLQLAGPSGALRLSGRTDLADETLDMRLVVILPLTQNLPIAAILMGASPPVGGALFVLDKLLGEPLSKLTSATYSVGGTWDNPQVRLRNIFDSGNQD